MTATIIGLKGPEVKCEPNPGPLPPLPDNPYLPIVPTPCMFGEMPSLLEELSRDDIDAEMK